MGFSLSLFCRPKSPTYAFYFFKLIKSQVDPENLYFLICFWKSHTTHFFAPFFLKPFEPHGAYPEKVCQTTPFVLDASSLQCCVTLVNSSLLSNSRFSNGIHFDVIFFHCTGCLPTTVREWNQRVNRMWVSSFPKLYWSTRFVRDFERVKFTCSPC